MTDFLFSFRETQSAYGHLPTFLRGISASDSPHGKFNRYFDAFVDCISLDDLGNITEQVSKLENSIIDEVAIGGNDWNITIKLEGVIICNEVFDEWNSGAENIFSFETFKWVFFAWREFLLLPDYPAGTKFIFELPSIPPPPILEPPAKLLKMCSLNG